ncbi:two-component system sensor histidine kinase NtrB [Desulforhopalus singaporensis]|uniref:histidine kinase n=1 Tax=Desulforhopalus singaporensis TaxID=91360 RepID=A0A1H0MTG1_9BACT|nr:ATP-binding protein [Desulforhopalus singaporensis]SDO83738.1 PAS/PAC sensor signal transduction histidine kinase [Desulforhopalus singaporensis]
MLLSFLNNKGRQDEDVDRLFRNQLLWVLLLRVILYTLLLVFSSFFQESPLSAIYFIRQDFLLYLLIIVVTASCFSSYSLLSGEKNLIQFCYLQIFLDTVFASLLIFFSGSVNTTLTSVYFFPIIAGGLLLPYRGGLFAAAAVTLEYGLLLALDLHALLPLLPDTKSGHTTIDITTGLNGFAIHGLTAFLAAFLSRIFGKRLQSAEIALKDSKKELNRLTTINKQIIDNIASGIFSVDGDGVITSANNAIEKITGLNPSTLPGKNIYQVIPGIDLDTKKIRHTIDFVKDTGIIRIGYTCIEIHSGDNRSDNATRPDMIINLRDVDQIESMEKQARQKEKLAAIGMMSASIAHDFRNPLTAISGSAQVLVDEFSPAEQDGTNHELAQIIVREAERLNNRIGDFLKFSRPENISCQWFSLAGCLEEVIEVLQINPNWSQTVKVSHNFKPALDVWGDQNQLFTVLSHLMQNSMLFCPQGSERIHVCSKEITTADNSEMLEISVADNGTGIAHDGLDKVFDPFWTTRVEGTGLGLAIVRQIVEAHQGTVEVSNDGLMNPEGNSGALFTVKLPIPEIDS